VHALGDRAVKESLNGIGAARKPNGNSGLPDTLTHVQLADPEDFPRFKELGVIAALQLLWATAEPDTIELVKPYIDPELYRWQYPARSLLDAGATISGASDWFVSSPNVFWAIYEAETRKGVEGVLDPKVSPAMIGWTWLSIKPGSSDLPCKSIFSATGDAACNTSGRFPTATILSPRIATASAYGLSGTPVNTLALKKTRSA
jgi:Amidohydrolase family